MGHFGFYLAVVAWGATPLVQVAGLVLRKSSEVRNSTQSVDASQANRSSAGKASASSDGGKSDFHEKHNIEHAHACLKGKRIVFIGPSTAKSDYLALVYFAEYGRWPDKDTVVYGAPGQVAASGPNPLLGPALEYQQNVGGRPPPAATAGCKVGTAESYLSYSNSIFNGHEMCDCYKNDPSKEFHIADIYNQTENRIYANGNTMIAYFQWFGDTVGPRGSVDFSPLTYEPWSADPFHSINQQCSAGQFKGSFDWSIPIPHFISNFVKALKPSHVVVDAAYWPTNPQNSQFWEEISLAGADAVRDTMGSAFWRTVPLRDDYPIAEPSSSVNKMHFTNHGWKTWDASAVVKSYRAHRVDTEIFSDTVHLRPHTESYLMWNFLLTNVCPVYGR